jgi:hypothetical protein
MDAELYERYYSIKAFQECTRNAIVKENRVLYFTLPLISLAYIKIGQK